MCAGRLLGASGLACILFGGLASAQSRFQLTVSQQGNAFVVPNGATLSFTDPVGQTETVRITATYLGLGQINITQLPQVFGSPAFTASYTGKLPLTLDNGGSFFFDIQFRPTSSTQVNAQLSVFFIETLSGGPPTFAPTFVNGSINLSLTGTAPSFVLSYILRSDLNVVTLPPGGSLEFPATPINTTTQATFNITNRGSGSGQISAISVTGSAFKLTGLPLFPVSLAAGQSLQLVVQYAPTEVRSDVGQIQITVDPNITLTAGLRGSGTSTASTLTYQVLDGTSATPVDPGTAISLFPDTKVGETASLSIEVKNTGNAPGPITTLSLAGAGFQLSDTPAVLPTLAPNASLTFTVTFAPPRPGNFTGRLTVGADTFTLLGKGLGPTLTFSYGSNGSTITLPASNGFVVFSPVMVSKSAELDFVVSNTGTLPTTVANIGVGEQVGPYSVSGLPPLPVTVDPNSDVRFTIRYTPVTTGFSNGTLRIDTTVVGLTGSGMPPPPLPAYTIQGPSGNVAPQSQPSVRISLASPYPIAVAGTLTMSVATDLVTDPAVQFATGGRTVQFTIPANTTDAVFAGQGPQIRLQTGTVASVISLTASFSTQAGGLNLTPDAPRSLQFEVAPAAPVLIAGRVANVTANGFAIIVTGYSTTRSITALNAQFAAVAGFNVPQTQFTVDLRQTSILWFQSGGSQAFGGQFAVVIPFTFQGTPPAGQSVLESVGSISVTVSNESGSSNSLRTTVSGRS